MIPPAHYTNKTPSNLYYNGDIYGQCDRKPDWALYTIHSHTSCNAPVNILPARGGGGHTRGFRQKTIPDRREFDKLMESGSRVI